MRLKANNISTANARVNHRPGKPGGTTCSRCSQRKTFKPINRYRLASSVTHSVRRGLMLSIQVRNQEK